MKGIVIYGAGRHFSSGAKLDDLIGAIRGQSYRGQDGNAPAADPLLLDNLASFRFFSDCVIPVVAAIRGVCLGSGLELALFCHARVCGSGSVLGLPETGFGIIPGCGGILNMASLAGRARALETVLGGSTFTAEEALDWGVVDSVVPKKNVVDTAIRLIEGIAALGGYDRTRIGGYMNRLL